MPSVELLIAFFVTTAVFALVPGPAMLYAAAQTLARGRGPGLLASLGIHLGGYVHVIAAAAGLSVLFHAVPTLYMAVKLAGAGLSRLARCRASAREGAAGSHPATSRAEIGPARIRREHHGRSSQSQDGDFLRGVPAAIHRCVWSVSDLVAVRRSRNDRQPDVLIGGRVVRCSGRSGDREIAAFQPRATPDAACRRHGACRTGRPCGF